ncbi:hypothetical protein TIFTF001_035572 [Ficus carica]|uniref:Uncharacterized protein n=1 Tax=Ficus carica TaxID=3494 RepID=A0AA88E1T1_FICCA|nr:hypothetical protein TIFTF001_035547 [Ficus carica]GMN66492.1 hypothetical protein TIFTF001_035552 [Ficus carica]GMN66493.1 hypothetical protein TIFTF001_035566 [Ficus carica]GMN66512.1 hypothetical protein TIFTF001_035572 [Ficus carica]
MAVGDRRLGWRETPPKLQAGDDDGLGLHKFFAILRGLRRRCLGGAEEGVNDDPESPCSERDGLEGRIVGDRNCERDLLDQRILLRRGKIELEAMVAT